MKTRVEEVPEDLIADRKRAIDADLTLYSLMADQDQLIMLRTKNGSFKHLSFRTCSSSNSIALHLLLSSSFFFCLGSSHDQRVTVTSLFPPRPASTSEIRGVLRLTLNEYFFFFQMSVEGSNHDSKCGS